MDKPTQGQIREFWKWCGLLGWNRDKQHYRAGWYYGNEFVCENIPPIDLNNLFKYSMQNKELWIRVGLHHRVRLLQDWAVTLGGHPSIVDPALALFWALWQVWENK